MIKVERLDDMTKYTGFTLRQFNSIFDSLRREDFQFVAAGLDGIHYSIGHIYPKTIPKDHPTTDRCYKPLGFVGWNNEDGGYVYLLNCNYGVLRSYHVKLEEICSKF